MAKAARVLAGLMRDGWVEVRRPRVEFFYDDESHHWGFSSEDPAIVGGGDVSLEAAARHFSRVLADTLRWEQENMATVSEEATVPAHA